jgi:prepilin-type N-terminal cleavage/methylation domain-containing protein
MKSPQQNSGGTSGLRQAQKNGSRRGAKAQRMKLCAFAPLRETLPSRSLLATGNLQLAPSPGFTLIEMITVLTIIIIVLAIAIPVWNALMGGTNLAAAQNQISAFLSNARTDAIYNRQTIGVFFFIDPKTQQTAMAEVQVQTLWQIPYPGTGSTESYTSLFQPGIWTPGSPPTYAPSTTAVNGPVNSIELVNNPDPNTPGNYIFYRDIVLLPKGVGVALNNPTYAYNNYNSSNQYSPGVWNPNSFSVPLDRYLRLGVIMFNSDGTLANIPFGIPLYEYFTSQQYTNKQYSENLLCQRLGITTSLDIASNVVPPNNSTPPTFPLWSSVGLVVYDHDAYLNQHASATSLVPGDGAQFSDIDMNCSLTGAACPSTGPGFAADKFIEESWIDQNGTAFLVSPNSGSLLKAK